MLLEFFHNHRRGILVLVIIFVGLPMGILFGIPNPFVGNSGPAFNEVVIEVRGVPVDAQRFLSSFSNMNDHYRALGQEVPTTQQMIADGTVNDLIRSLADDAYLTSLTIDKPYRPNNDYLDQRLREYPDFKNDAGEFDPAIYNRWVTFNMESGGNWNSIRDMVAEQVKRDVYVNLLTASARTFESDIREQFETRNTKVRVRFAAVEAPIEVNDAALREYFDANVANYQTEQERRAMVVAIDVPNEPPAILDDLLARARAGEDFAQMAREHSVSGSGPDGGELGWFSEADTLPEFQRTVFSLKPGEVADPVDGPIGLHIFKAEEERTNEETGAREVFAREIVLLQRPSRDAIDAAMASAKEFADSVRGGTALADAASAAGLETIDTGFFDRTAFELSGIDSSDSLALRQALVDLDLNGVIDPLESGNTIYVAQVTEIQEPRAMEFDEAREDVERDWTFEQKQSGEYHDAVHEYIDKITADGGTLTDAAAKYPELNMEPAETKLFGATDMLFDQGWLVDPSLVIRTATDLEVGEIGGPVKDFQGIEYLVEILEKQGPTDEMWENEWPDVRASTQEAMRNQFAVEQLDDFLLHGMERATENEEVYVFQEAIEVLLGVDTSEPLGTTDAETAPAEEGDVATF